MHWVIEIRKDNDGSPVALAPLITARAGDDIVWFIQSAQQRPFKVLLEWLDESPDFAWRPAFADLPVPDDDVGPRRELAASLPSLPIQAVRLRVPDGYEGRAASYRIAYGDADDANAPTAPCGIVQIGYHFLASSTGPEVREGRPEV